jgi:hypothetical protein
MVNETIKNRVIDIWLDSALDKEILAWMVSPLINLIRNFAQCENHGAQGVPAGRNVCQYRQIIDGPAVCASIAADESTSVTDSDTLLLSIAGVILDPIPPRASKTFSNVPQVPKSTDLSCLMMSTTVTALELSNGGWMPLVTWPSAHNDWPQRRTSAHP